MERNNVLRGRKKKPESLNINLWQEYICRETKPKTKQELIDGIQSFWRTVDIPKCKSIVHQAIIVQNFNFRSVHLVRTKQVASRCSQRALSNDVHCNCYAI